jgi:hypothetical protein
VRESSTIRQNLASGPLWREPAPLSSDQDTYETNRDWELASLELNIIVYTMT